MARGAAVVAAGAVALAALLAAPAVAVTGGGPAAPRPLPRPPAAAFAQEDPQVVRLAGPERIATAVTISRDQWMDGGAASAVLARADLFPDALSGAPLAAEVIGPLLLTRPDALPADVATELLRAVAPAADVYILGGTAAIQEPVAEQVRDLGFTPVRLAGETRFGTAVAVAQVAGRDGVEFITIADGGSFPDALVAGALAAGFVGGVTVLSNGSTLTPETRDFLQQYDVSNFTSAGPAADMAVDGEYTVPGDTPELRSVQVGRVFYVDPTRVAVASSLQFPDALAGGAHAAFQRAPLLLAPRSFLPDEAQAFVSDSPMTAGYLYGGQAALELAVEQQLLTALSSAP